MAYTFPTVSIGTEVLTLVGMGAASVAGVGKFRELRTQLMKTIQKARSNRLPLGELACESMKEAAGWNRMRGQESAILSPRPEEVLMAQNPRPQEVLLEQIIVVRGGARSPER